MRTAIYAPHAEKRFEYSALQAERIVSNAELS
jgi:hypothetical protein